MAINTHMLSTLLQVGSALSSMLMKHFKVETYMKYVFGLSAASLGVPFLLHLSEDGTFETYFTHLHTCRTPSKSSQKWFCTVTNQKERG
jgi:hypothetical protein